METKLQGGIAGAMELVICCTALAYTMTSVPLTWLPPKSPFCTVLYCCRAGPHCPLRTIIKAGSPEMSCNVTVCTIRR